MRLTLSLLSRVFQLDKQKSVNEADSQYKNPQIYYVD